MALFSEEKDYGYNEKCSALGWCNCYGKLDNLAFIPFSGIAPIGLEL